MKLFIDTTVFLNHPCGISVYLLQTLKHLAELDPALSVTTGLKSWNPKTIFRMGKILRELLPSATPSFRVIPLPRNAGGRLGKFSSARYDLIHFPANYMPSYVPFDDLSNGIITLHDMIFFHAPKEEQGDWERFMTETIPSQIRQARAIVTVSEFSKKEILHFCPVPPEKIHVIPIAAQWDGVLQKKTGILAKCGLAERNYFLSVSRLERHKNFPTLCKAFTLYRESPSYRGEKLVIVGAPGLPEIRDEILRTKDVIHLQNISTEDLQTLYACSKGFFLLSSLEGFGIPLLEAMKAGVPVCYGKGNSMDEIARDRCFAVNGKDPEEAAKIFERFSCWGEDPELDAKVEGAQKIASTYSWENSARQLYELYRELV